MKKIIIFVAFSIISMLASAYTLSGRIKTDADAALPFVSVYFKDAHVGATTDLDGKYTIADMKNKKVDSRIIEFQEFAKNVYMPVSKYSVIDLNIEKVLNDELDNLNKENTSSMSAKQLEKHNDRKRKLQETLDAGNSKVKISVTLNYKDFKPVK